MREVRAASGLRPGEHLFRLLKRSETIGSQVEVGRVRIDPGAALLKARKPAARRIEIGGDSYTVGYGVESPGRGGPGTQDETGRDCDDEKLRATTNTFAAQGWIAAELLGADAQTNAISGLGLVRAYAGDTSWLPFPEYYGRVLQNRAEPLYDPARPPFGEPWKPQVVVVALGTNDFSTELAPHEAKRFADRAALRAAWKKAYAEFLARLRRLYPGARFVLVSTNLATGNELADGVRDVVAEEEKAGRKDLAAVDLPSLTQYGCHWHPDLATQKKNGRLLAEAISRLTGWNLAGGR
jgi:lysophospholipase L1-like esterase